MIAERQPTVHRAGRDDAPFPKEPVREAFAQVGVVMGIGVEDEATQTHEALAAGDADLDRQARTGLDAGGVETPRQAARAAFVAHLGRHLRTAIDQGRRHVLLSDRVSIKPGKVGRRDAHGERAGRRVIVKEARASEAGAVVAVSGAERHATGRTCGERGGRYRRGVAAWCGRRVGTRTQ
mgnify:CR=1 FL=1